MVIVGAWVAVDFGLRIGAWSNRGLRKRNSQWFQPPIHPAFMQRLLEVKLTIPLDVGLRAAQHLATGIFSHPFR